MTPPPEPPVSPTPDLQEFPTFRLGSFLPAFLLGWGAGVALTFAVRGVGGALLTGPCEGRTVLALLVPLLLGPGGLAFTAANWRRPRRAALGLGLVLASLLPALYVGAQDIGGLRRTGCAGGYVVVSRLEGNGQAGGSVSSVSLVAGTSQELTARVGGYTQQTHPGVFTVRAQGSAPGINVTVTPERVRAGEPFRLTVSAAASAPVNTYTVGVSARTAQGGKTVEATGTIEVNVRPAVRPPAQPEPAPQGTPPATP
ncbi:hypothetical protein GCM10008959_24910 [Deinococcus seoulensis]|uniref:Carboxypeptidase regulatory-like domain-containing protein n=1 Tax=Deinococcus seoulensis TaxID=1837379 RepID=A0ABQ2RT24_9DEIO|nr:hypothetical protein [Deinococcus seoulensis]GGR61911.1 hypothetical protein GCM10008959_24910 [Deinococcus seoulensis]